MPRTYSEELVYADRYGYAMLPSGYELVFTVNDLPVAQHTCMGKRDYRDLADAERSGCLVLRPDLFKKN